MRQKLGIAFLFWFFLFGLFIFKKTDPAELYQIDAPSLSQTLFFYTLPALLTVTLLVLAKKEGPQPLRRRAEELVRAFLFDRASLLALPFLALGLTCAALLGIGFNRLLQEGGQQIIFQKTVAVLILLAFSTFASALLEELFFRLWLPQELEAGGLKSSIALTISALLFGLSHLHQGLPSTLQALVAGFVLSAGAKKTKRLSAPLLVHIAFNISVFWFNLHRQ